MKRKKLTKRQLLNELLAAEESQQKINNSQARLWNREENLNEKRKGLSQELADVLYEERKKNGDDDEPIIYKGHMFNVSGARGAYCDASCVIKAIKSVK